MKLARPFMPMIALDEYLLVVGETFPAVLMITFWA